MSSDSYVAMPETMTAVYEPLSCGVIGEPTVGLVHTLNTSSVVRNLVRSKKPDPAAGFVSNSGHASPRRRAVHSDATGAANPRRSSVYHVHPVGSCGKTSGAIEDSTGDAVGPL